MKVFYSPEIDFKFSQYGIEIPIVDTRASLVFYELKKIFPKLDYFNTNDIPVINRKDLLLSHDEEFVNELFKSYKSLEAQILKAYELIDENGKFNRYNPDNAILDFSNAFDVVLKQVGLTYYSSREALKTSFSYFLGGGMHHAMSFTGRGFCLVNDLVISIRKLQLEKLVKTVWIIDVDAHKGDGAAEITKSDNTIITFSIHMKEGWPLDSGNFRDPWFIPSNLDIGIDVNEESIYLEKLDRGLAQLKENYPIPDLAIIVNGADAYEFDELPSTQALKLSKKQMLDRDILVYQFLKDLKIPQSYVMAGGYGANSWEIYFQFLKFVGENSP